MYFLCNKDKTFVVLEGRILWTELCPPPNSYIEDLISNVTVFGDRAFKEVINSEIIRVVLSSNRVSVHIRGRDNRYLSLSLSLHTEKFM